jgi:hypothetical protein
MYFIHWNRHHKFKTINNFYGAINVLFNYSLNSVQEKKIENCGFV